VADRNPDPARRAISFGPFRLLPSQKLLLEDEAPVRVGSRSLEVLCALVERPGELVSKSELMARVWPGAFVDESNLKVHVAGLRRALGDGQPGRRYLANVPGRGYCFVAPVNLHEPEGTPPQNVSVSERLHNLPAARSRLVGRYGLIRSLVDQLPKLRFVTIVGPGGIGKTAVALAIAEALLPSYADGVRFVDLSRVLDPQHVSVAFAATLGITVQSAGDIGQLIDVSRDKHMLVLLDTCEHVTDAAAVN